MVQTGGVQPDGQRFPMEGERRGSFAILGKPHKS